ncbi:MAG: hypothetical protein QF416_02840 [Candidatus Marinimicrobia bacterium]|jgi:hypothetical protein|nr:hypothetical protein [Candidatus Neomarinimicrobiota bacterium]
MSFKFKLGDLVIPSMPKEMGIPVGPSTVTAIQLGGYIQIQPVGAESYRRQLVRAEQYEKFEEETKQSHN